MAKNEPSKPDDARINPGHVEAADYSSPAMPAALKCP